MNVFEGILETACLSACSCVVCVQNTSFCQSTGWGIKLHLVTALYFSFPTIFLKALSVMFFKSLFNLFLHIYSF